MQEKEKKPKGCERERGQPGNKKSQKPQCKMEGRKRGQEDLRKQRKTGQRVKHQHNPIASFSTPSSGQSHLHLSSIFFSFLWMYIKILPSVTKSQLNVQRELVKYEDLKHGSGNINSHGLIGRKQKHSFRGRVCVGLYKQYL